MDTIVHVEQKPKKKLSIRWIVPFCIGMVFGGMAAVKMFKVDANITALPYKENYYITAVPTTLTGSRYQTIIPAGTIVREVYETEYYRKFQVEFLYDKSNKGLVPLETSKLTEGFIYH